MWRGDEMLRKLSVVLQLLFLRGVICSQAEETRMAESHRLSPYSLSPSSEITGLTGCSYSATCSVGGVEGACVSASSGCCSGVLTTGLCPGSSDVQCCTSSKCSTPSGEGVCLQTSLCKTQNGVSIAGYCVGPSDLQCCVEATPNDWYFENWCAQHNLEYLDDSKCQKKFPSHFDREDWTCPIAELDQPPDVQGYYLDGRLDAEGFTVDTTSLSLSSPANLCLIVTKRVRDGSSSTLKLYNKYFCSGDYSLTEAYETWSSSKIFAMANAAGRLRGKETTCTKGELGAGLDSLVLDSKHGSIPLGDLSTVVCSYDETAGYSSNSLSSYFNDIGWRESENQLLSSWLGAVPNSQGQSLGGNYGESSPSDLGFGFTETDGDVCSADKDKPTTTYSNHISALSAAEMARRIALHRETSESTRFPFVTWEDIKSELYGANESVLFPGLKWGGMTADTAIFIQSALNMTQVENDSMGKWRIFSKLGAGYSSSRYVGEIVTTGYACLPKLDPMTGTPLSGEGWEFSISARGSMAKDASLAKAQDVVLIAVQEAIGALITGKLHI